MEERVASLREVRAVLSAEHEHLWGLLAAVRRAANGDRRSALSRLLRYLAVHEAAEQVAMHNVWVDDSTRERLDEEREAAEIVERLVRAAETAPAPALEANDDEFLITLDQLERTLREHAEAEENEELPILASRVSPTELGEMLRVLIMIREMGEDVATPVAEDSFAGMRLAAQREFRAAIAQLR